MTAPSHRVAVIARAQDRHVNLVARHLHHAPTILTDAPGEDISMRMPEMTLTPEILFHRRYMEIETTVWLRTLPTSQLVGALPFLLSKSSYVPSVAGIMGFAHPIVQLSYAKQAGLHVVPVLFTVSADEAREFVGLNPRCTIRPVSPDWLAGRRPISLRDDDALDAIQGVPTILQSTFTFSHNVRVVVVGNKVFAASVADFSPSVMQEQDTHDWRKGLQSNTFTATEKPLPAWLVNHVRTFMRLCGLRMAVIDFAVSREGMYVFMGCDPTGDWWFLEQYASLRIGQEVARLLQVGG